MTKAQNEITTLLQNDVTKFRMKSDIKIKANSKWTYYNSRWIILKVCKDIHTHCTIYVCLQN